MNEIGDFVRSVDRMSRKERRAGFYLIQYPSGSWGAAGFGIPIEVAYIDPTPEKLEAAKFGGRFGPKTRTFATWQDGEVFCNELGFYADSSGRFEKQS